VKEVAAALDLVALFAEERMEHGASAPARPAAADLHICCTSLGVQISGSRIRRGPRGLRHYAISLQDGVMTGETARLLATLITQLKHPSSPGELIGGSQGVFHLLVHA
jgi:hypothetical protein